MYEQGLITLSVVLGALRPPGPEFWEGAEGGTLGPAPNDIRGSDPLGGGRLPPSEAGRSSRGGPAGGRPGMPGGRPPGN